MRRRRETSQPIVFSPHFYHSRFASRLTKKELKRSVFSCKIWKSSEIHATCMRRRTEKRYFIAVHEYILYCTILYPVQCLSFSAGNRDATHNAEFRAFSHSVQCTEIRPFLSIFVQSLPRARPVCDVTPLHVVSQAVDHLRNLPLFCHLVAEEFHLDVALVRAFVHPLFVPAFRVKFQLKDGNSERQFPTSMSSLPSCLLICRRS